MTRSAVAKDAVRAERSLHVWSPAGVVVDDIAALPAASRDPGIGFPPWTGGVMQYIDGYSRGTTGFVAQCKALADAYGDRFVPSVSRTGKAESGDNSHRTDQLRTLAREFQAPTPAG